MKNKVRRVNENLRNISKNFVDEQKVDESIKNEISKEFNNHKNNRQNKG